MGLDMYLYGERYISRNYSDDPIATSNALLTTLKELDLLDDDAIEKENIYGYSAKVVVKYWRKAWPIHRWFVENVQNGEDNCGEYRVQTDALQQLLSDCQAVLSAKDDPDIAHDTAWAYIPPSENLEYNAFEDPREAEYYYYHIERTAKVLKHLLTDKKFEDYDFYYSSSW